jgi:hypothetical protein
MRKRIELTQKRLREVLCYDHATGIFTWAASRHRVIAGKQAGKLKLGYRRICIDGVSYQASGLAWFYVHGEWPSRMLRFKDENRDNASIGNLIFGEVDSKDAEATAIYRRNYWRINRVGAHAKRIKNKYGVSLEQYQAMLLEQKGCCAICDKPETAAQQGRVITLSVDHDHADNTVRGLLCRTCNAMLGQSQDDESILTRAIAYLQAHAAKPKTNVIPLAGRRIANEKGS